MKKLYLFLVSLTFFSFLIFVLGNYFFMGSEKELNTRIENEYIEPSLTKNEYLLSDDSLEEKQKERITVALKSAYKIKFYYFPTNFKISINEYTNAFKVFLNSKWISDKINNLSIEFYKEKNDVRWKMKSNSIKLFWPINMWIAECSSVWIHEFWHYIDLYFLKKEVFTDLSDYFYNISWDKVKIMKAWQVNTDFVSGYAMTNKYEDFAESFVYFILHNDDFDEKSKNSIMLKAKYDFFTKYLFRDNEFVGTDFSVKNKIQLYYRDITKIEFSLENFLEFLKK